MIFGVPVEIDTWWLAPDQVGVMDGKIYAGSAEALDRLIEMWNARPWWRKLLDEFDAHDEAERKLAPLLAAAEAMGRSLRESTDAIITRALAPTYRYGIKAW